MIDQKRDVLGSFHKRRQPQCDYIQPVVQIPPKSTVLNFFVQISVGCGNNDLVEK